MVAVDNYNIEEIHFEMESESQPGDNNTFMQWLNLSKKENFGRHHKIKHQQDLIDTFIKVAPKIQPVKAAINSMEADLDIKPVKRGPNELIVSETLAKVYYEQKKYSLAIETYKKLKMLHPEKTSFFTAMIKEIEREQNQD